MLPAEPLLQAGIALIVCSAITFVIWATLSLPESTAVRKTGRRSRSAVPRSQVQQLETAPGQYTSQTGKKQPSQVSPNAKPDRSHEEQRDAVHGPLTYARPCMGGETGWGKAVSDTRMAGLQAGQASAEKDMLDSAALCDTPVTMAHKQMNSLSQLLSTSASLPAAEMPGLPSADTGPSSITPPASGYIGQSEITPDSPESVCQALPVSDMSAQAWKHSSMPLPSATCQGQTASHRGGLNMSKAVVPSTNHRPSNRISLPLDVEDIRARAAAAEQECLAEMHAGSSTAASRQHIRDKLRSRPCSLDRDKQSAPPTALYFSQMHSVKLNGKVRGNNFLQDLARALTDTVGHSLLDDRGCLAHANIAAGTGCIQLLGSFVWLPLGTPARAHMPTSPCSGNFSSLATNCGNWLASASPEFALSMALAVHPDTAGNATELSGTPAVEQPKYVFSNGCSSEAAWVTPVCMVKSETQTLSITLTPEHSRTLDQGGAAVRVIVCLRGEIVFDKCTTAVVDEKERSVYVVRVEIPPLLATDDPESCAASSRNDAMDVQPLQLYVLADNPTTPTTSGTTSTALLLGSATLLLASPYMAAEFQCVAENYLDAVITRPQGSCKDPPGGSTLASTAGGSEQQTEVDNSALACMSLAWRQHLQPFVRDVAFLIDTADAVSEALRAYESDALQPTERSQVEAQMQAWNQVLQHVLLHAAIQQAPGICHTLLAMAEYAGVTICQGNPDKLLTADQAATMLIRDASTVCRAPSGSIFYAFPITIRAWFGQFVPSTKQPLPVAVLYFTAAAAVLGFIMVVTALGNLMYIEAVQLASQMSAGTLQKFAIAVAACGSLFIPGVRNALGSMVLQLLEHNILTKMSTSPTAAHGSSSSRLVDTIDEDTTPSSADMVSTVFRARPAHTETATGLDRDSAGSGSARSGPSASGISFSAMLLPKTARATSQTSSASSKSATQERQLGTQGIDFQAEHGTVQQKGEGTGLTPAVGSSFRTAGLLSRIRTQVTAAAAGMVRYLSSETQRSEHMRALDEVARQASNTFQWSTSPHTRSPAALLCHADVSPSTVTSVMSTPTSSRLSKSWSISVPDIDAWKRMSVDREGSTDKEAAYAGTQQPSTHESLPYELVNKQTRLGLTGRARSAWPSKPSVLAKLRVGSAPAQLEMLGPDFNYIPITSFSQEAAAATGSGYGNSLAFVKDASPASNYVELSCMVVTPMATSFDHPSTTAPGTSVLQPMTTPQGFKDHAGYVTDIDTASHPTAADGVSGYERRQMELLMLESNELSNLLSTETTLLARMKGSYALQAPQAAGFTETRQPYTRYDGLSIPSMQATISGSELGPPAAMGRKDGSAFLAASQQPFKPAAHAPPVGMLPAVSYSEPAPVGERPLSSYPEIHQLSAVTSTEQAARQGSMEKQRSNTCPLITVALPLQDPSVTLSNHSQGSELLRLQPVSRQHSFDSMDSGEWGRVNTSQLRTWMSPSRRSIERAARSFGGNAVGSMSSSDARSKSLQLMQCVAADITPPLIKLPASQARSKTVQDAASSKANQTTVLHLPNIEMPLPEGSLLSPQRSALDTERMASGHASTPCASAPYMFPVGNALSDANVYPPSPRTKAQNVPAYPPATPRRSLQFQIGSGVTASVPSNVIEPYNQDYPSPQFSTPQRGAGWATPGGAGNMLSRKAPSHGCLLAAGGAGTPGFGLAMPPPSPRRMRTLPPPSPLLKAEMRMSGQHALLDAETPAGSPMMKGSWAMPPSPVHVQPSVQTNASMSVADQQQDQASGSLDRLQQMLVTDLASVEASALYQPSKQGSRSLQTTQSSTDAPFHHAGSGMSQEYHGLSSHEASREDLSYLNVHYSIAEPQFMDGQSQQEASTSRQTSAVSPDLAGLLDSGVRTTYVPVSGAMHTQENGKVTSPDLSGQLMKFGDAANESPDLSGLFTAMPDSGSTLSPPSVPDELFLHHDPVTSQSNVSRLSNLLTYNEDDIQPLIEPPSPHEAEMTTTVTYQPYSGTTAYSPDMSAAGRKVPCSPVSTPTVELAFDDSNVSTPDYGNPELDTGSTLVCRPMEPLASPAQHTRQHGDSTISGPVRQVELLKQQDLASHQSVSSSQSGSRAAGTGFDPLGTLKDWTAKEQPGQGLRSSPVPPATSAKRQLQWNMNRDGTAQARIGPSALTATATETTSDPQTTKLQGAVVKMEGLCTASPCRLWVHRESLAQALAPSATTGTHMALDGSNLERPAAHLAQHGSVVLHNPTCVRVNLSVMVHAQQ